GLDHDVDLEVLPGQRPGITFPQHADLLAVHDDTGVRRLDLAGEGSVVGVVLQQVSDGWWIDEVVQRQPLDVSVALVRRSEHVAADPSEAVDCNPYRHASDPPRSLCLDQSITPAHAISGSAASSSAAARPATI